MAVIGFFPTPFPNKEKVFSLLFMTNKEIAAHLHICHRTVDGYIVRIKEELGVDTRVGALWQGMRLGWPIDWEEFERYCR